MSASFRLTPNAANGGDTLNLEVQGITKTAEFVGKTFEILIVEVDKGRDKGRPVTKDDALAKFQMEVLNKGTEAKPILVFDKVTRTDSNPTAIPPEPARFSTEGEALSFAPGFKPPHFKLTFTTSAGKTSAFLILIQGDAGEIENYVYEIGFRVSVAGKSVFESTAMPTFLDCKKLLIHNCVQAANMQIADHREMVRKRTVGLRYGSQCVDPSLSGDKSSYQLESTSCIDYQLDVTAIGHEKTLAQGDWKNIKKYMKNGTGTTLFKGFQDAGWIGLYYNPDVKNPYDKSGEHSYSYTVVKKNAKYYELKVRDSIINYRPTTVFEDGTVPKTITAKESVKVNLLKAIEFGVLVARGGTHTAIIMSGLVYEVHWDKSARDLDLYEATDFETGWAWLSGLIMIPPGQWK